MSKYLCHTSDVYSLECVCLYMHVEGSVFLCDSGGGGGGVEREGGAAISCVQVAIFEGWLGGGCEDVSALCVGTPRSSLLIHCSPAPTNR